MIIILKIKLYPYGHSNGERALHSGLFKVKPTFVFFLGKIIILFPNSAINVLENIKC